MKFNKALILIISLSLISFSSFGQAKNYKDARSLAEKYFHCLLTNDTNELRNDFIDKPFIVFGVDYSLQGNPKDSIRVDSLVRKRFDKIEAKIYFTPFSKIEHLLDSEHIAIGRIDSIHLLKINTDSKSIGAEYTLSTYFTSTSRNYFFNLELIKYQDNWHLVEIEDNLEGPY